MTAGASVLDARKEKRRERCALCELYLLVNMNQNPKHKPVKQDKPNRPATSKTCNKTKKHKTLHKTWY